MVRGISLALGLGLFVLWLVALGSPVAPAWLAWLEFVGAICGFIIGAAATPEVKKETVTAGPIALAVGLFVLWIAALSASAVSWLTWWTFAFACGYALLALAAVAEIPEGRNRYRAPDAPAKTG